MVVGTGDGGNLRLGKSVGFPSEGRFGSRSTAAETQSPPRRRHAERLQGTGRIGPRPNGPPYAS